MKMIDSILNKITMYRLVLYCLIFLLGVGFILSFFKLLPFQPFDLLAVVIYFVAVCFATNFVFAWVFEAPSNLESVYITALILVLIVTPARPFENLLSFGWIAVIAIASKYILAINKKHIFNPAALAVALTAFTINQSASWWVANLYMAPFVLVVGLLIAKKIKRYDLVLSFFIVAMAVVFIFSRGNNLLASLERTIIYSPVMFLAFIMLTEPMTTPPTRKLRIVYGALVGLLFSPQIHIGSVYSTPELALLAGNIFVYLVSPKEKLVLKLKQKIKIAPDAYDFIFKTDKKLIFTPGQYMEWTLDHTPHDNRGIRRFFTLASSPTEDDIRMGIKFYDNSSTYKKSLLALEAGDKIIASQLSGDFVLPKNKDQKFVLISGGIGITPFRSMIKYLVDTDERRPITIFYSNKLASEILYQDVLKVAEDRLGIKTFYTITDRKNIPVDWKGFIGHFTKEMIVKEVPDYKENIFYISGPHQMVVGFEKLLKEMGIKANQIKIDFFPGFAG